MHDPAIALTLRRGDDARGVGPRTGFGHAEGDQQLPPRGSRQVGRLERHRAVADDRRQREHVEVDS